MNIIWAFIIFLFCTSQAFTTDVHIENTYYSYHDLGFPLSNRLDHTCVVFKNRLWVIGGSRDGNKSSNDIWWSSDGSTWHLATDSPPFSPRLGHSCLAFDNKLWVIGGVEVKKEMVIAGGGFGRIGGILPRDVFTTKNDVWWSADGINWSRATAAARFSTRHHHSSLVFDNKMWVIGGSRNSSSGEMMGLPHDFDFTKKLLNDVWCSSDGKTWKRINKNSAFAPRESHASLVFNNKMWVIGGHTGPQAEDWEKEIVSSRETAWKALKSEPGYSNEVWCSVDGKNWTQLQTPKSFPPRAGQAVLEFNGELWMLGGYAKSGRNAGAWHSVTGENWENNGVIPHQKAGIFRVERNSPMVATVFQNKMWIVGGEPLDFRVNGSQRDPWYLCSDNVVQCSADGKNWNFPYNRSRFSPRAMHGGAVFNDKMWVISGFGDGAGNDAWWSRDGDHWTSTTLSSPPKMRLGSVKTIVNANNLWVLGHNDNQNYLWSTKDGTSWTIHEKHIEGQNYMSPLYTWDIGLSLKNKMWRIDPYFQSWSQGGVSYSDDGISWTEVLSKAPDFMSTYNTHYYYQGVSFKNRLWIFRGFDEQDGATEIWSSEDGKTWTKAVSKAVFPARQRSTLVVYNDKLWIIGGSRTEWSKGEDKFPHPKDVYLNDVWWSADGIKWNLAVDKAEFPGRAGHVCLTYDGKLWIIGGFDGLQMRDDVWCSINGVDWREVDSSSASRTELN